MHYILIAWISLANLSIYCLARRTLEDPKDILGLHKRMHSKDAEFTDLGKEYVRGSIWPKPQSEVRSSTIYHILPQQFQFKIIEREDNTGGNAQKHKAILQNAIARYRQLTFPQSNTCQERVEDDEENSYINHLNIQVQDYVQPIGEKMNESYSLKIDAEGSVLKSHSVWGALRGLETFSQTVHINGSCYKVHRNYIKDKPRFSFRAFLIDTSRHFIPKKVIFAFLDAMSYSKFNVLHWHAVDDPSFPFESKTFPNLHKKGAFTPKHVYRPKDVQDIIEYARLRGIRVMPEFDTPGHVHSWSGQKGLLTDCESTSQVEEMFKDLKGPIDPTLQANYEFLKDFFKELSEVFPDTMIHLGGDEVDFTCWESNQKIKEWLEQKPGRKVQDLHTLFLNKLVEITTKLNKTNVVWQEVFDDNVRINPKNTIVNVWKQDQGNSWKEEIGKVTAKGFRTILSSPWYLNYIAYGLDWPNFYKEDPQGPVQDQKAQSDLVIGGSACMWGEYVDSTNILQRSFGRSFAVAERLWSDKSVNNVKEAMPRIWEHRCRYLERGIPAEPVTRAKFCVHEWGE